MNENEPVVQHGETAKVNNKFKVKIPLRTVLLVPFLLQILIVTGLAGYLSYRNGQKAVNEVAAKLHSEINARISEYLKDFIETPGQIIQNNAVAISHGLLNYHDQFMLEHFFLEQIQIYKTVSSIYFGSTTGGISSAGREADTRSEYFMATDGFRKGTLRKYSINAMGKRNKVLLNVPNFDSRTRPWYRSAIASGNTAWSDAYILFTGQDMAISASKPVYGVSRELLGVVSVDLFLSHISSFLAEMDIGKTGLCFIIDRDGLLIASSTKEMIFTSKRTGQIQRRLGAWESDTQLIRTATIKLLQTFGTYRNIKGNSHLDFKINGENKFMHVSPVINQDGIEWSVITVIPESDFMEKIKSNNRITLLLICIALIITVVIGYFTSRWIAEPVLRLKSTVRAMSAGEWPENSGESAISEIDDLKSSFFHMSGQLKNLVESLTVEIKERQLTEDALRKSEEKYRDLVQLSNSIILRMDNKGIITYVNDYALNFFGYTEEELILKNVIGTIVPRTDKSGKNLEEMIDDIIRRPECFERNENENLRKDGSHVWVVWSNRGIADEYGNCTEILCIGTDITERRLAEVEVKKLLTEKELLLREVHHRIKNNMNTIAGLLYLQSASVDNESAASALGDAHNRVLSMMNIYDKLFRSSDFESVSTRDYLTELISGIISTFPDSGQVEIKTDIDDSVLNSNALVPIGIIINELLTNSFKYAFPSKNGSLIEIIFLKTGEESFEMIFKDNGVGVPESLVIGESKGFGLNLVNLLAQQMRGSVEIVRGNGTLFKIKFSV